CPVTGQPDWASMRIAYRGPRIERAGLLRYLVSFREHAGFHEQCVERIFVDVLARCRPEALAVEARYTRRGGLDINPWRVLPGTEAPAAARELRQCTEDSCLRAARCFLNSLRGTLPSAKRGTGGPDEQSQEPQRS